MTLQVEKLLTKQRLVVEIIFTGDTEGKPI
jgi:hypothetical protein